MQHGVNLAAGGFVAARQPRIARQPRRAESVGARSLAFKARAMPGRQGHGLVEEEELGVMAGLHQGETPAFTLKDADDPRFAAIRPNNLPLLVVQNAPIAHEQPAQGQRGDVAKWGDPVWLRHVLFPAGLCRVSLTFLRPLPDDGRWVARRWSMAVMRALVGAGWERLLRR